MLLLSEGSKLPKFNSISSSRCDCGIDRGVDGDGGCASDGCASNGESSSI